MLTGDMAALIGIATGLGSAAVFYGMLREKVFKNEQETARVESQLSGRIQDLKMDQKAYVPLQHFEAVVGPLQHTLDNVQTDIKLLLKMVSEK